MSDTSNEEARGQVETNWPEQQPPPDPTVPPKETATKRHEPPKEHRFKPGNQLARGHHADRAGAVAKLIARCQRAVKPKDWDEIVGALVAKAKRGDNKAAEWLWDRLVGKPKQQTELTMTPMFSLRMKVEERLSTMNMQPLHGRSSASTTDILAVENSASSALTPQGQIEVTETSGQDGG